MSGSSGGSSRQNFVIEEIRMQHASRHEALLQLVNSQICLRRVTLSFNLFFWITGPGLVGLGTWYYLALSQYQPIVERQDFAGPAYLILVAGGAAILAGIVGCLGGVNEHRHLLLLYTILVIIVCSLELSATVYTFTRYDKFSCCGIEGPKDWAPSANGSALTLPAQSESSTLAFELPYSCCLKGSSDQGQCSNRSTGYKGCLSPVLDWLRRILIVSGWSSFAAACSQVTNTTNVSFKGPE